jgi:hypothetical protein
MPATPTDVTATAGVQQITVNWASSANATGYHLHRSATPGGTVTYITVPTGDGDSYTDTGLTPGQTYYYTVVAVNSTYNTSSAASAQVSAKPTAPTPSVPTNVTATAGVQQITVSWAASTNATAYHLHRSTTPGGTITYITVPSGDGDNYTDTGLTVGQTYYYTAEAVNSTYGTDSAPSAQVSAVPIAPTPSVPTNVTATAGVQQITVSWVASTNATSYHLHRSKTPGGTITYITVPTADGDSYTDTGLTVGQTYYYTVEAVNSTYGTDSAPSAQVSAVPNAPIPSVPTNVAAVGGPSAGKIIITWSASTNATVYHLHRSTSPGGTITYITVPTADGDSYTDTGLTVGQTYYYTVEAVNTTYGTDSAPSAQVSAAAP